MPEKKLYAAPWTPNEFQQVKKEEEKNMKIITKNVKTCFCGARLEEYCPGCFRCPNCESTAVTDLRGWLFFTKKNIPKKTLFS